VHCDGLFAKTSLHISAVGVGAALHTPANTMPAAATHICLCFLFICPLLFSVKKKYRQRNGGRGFEKS